jgi:hypothetical protein
LDLKRKSATDKKSKGMAHGRQGTTPPVHAPREEQLSRRKRWWVMRWV